MVRSSTVVGYESMKLRIVAVAAAVAAVAVIAAADAVDAADEEGLAGRGQVLYREKKS